MIDQWKANREVFDKLTDELIGRLIIEMKTGI